MAIVRQLLRNKGNQVWTIQPSDSVLDAIRIMAERDIGALVVIEGNQPIGILSERDYTRNVYLKGRTSPGTAVREIMSAPIVSAQLDDTVEACMELMTERRIRHLPIVEYDKLVGLVSIGDLVKSIISEQEHVIEQLQLFIQS
ncbi:MAG: CBS domain-containing protein [Rhodospirillaceae bacterium]|jgi:CBS domain-containing protein|nr:CBS domain-containing protein [Rhodospirillaceae bacterium]MBT6119002.1 CBS domain-containing protein [Rhodospirillaceae bacterium]